MSLIKQLREGKIAIENREGTLEELIRVLKEAYPKDHYDYDRDLIMDNRHLSKYYRTQELNISYWIDKNKTDLPSYPISAFIQEIDNQIVMKKTIKYTEAQQIIDLACVSVWQPKLAKLWGADIAMKKDIDVSEELYQEGRKAANKEQNELLDKIFGSENQFKVGDHIIVVEGCVGFNGTKGQVYKVIRVSNEKLFYEEYNSIGTDKVKVRLATAEEVRKATYLPEGTPCMVSDDKVDWLLRYASGNNTFFAAGRQSGSTVIYRHFVKVDQAFINNLQK